MSDFEKSWELSRKRMVDELQGLSSSQLNWRLHPNSLTIGEMVLHVAGVEMSFGSQLLGVELDVADSRLKKAATDGVTNREVYPYAPDEITRDLLDWALDRGQAMVAGIMRDPSPVLQKEMVSALGPIITGEGALARLGFHSAYHQGQIYLIRTHPSFP